MHVKPYPLTFRPVYMSHIWGGSRLATKYHRTGTPDTCAESWEISDRAEGMSIVDRGPLAGTDLHSLVLSMQSDLVGSASKPDRFPLLVKILDARERLSVQVHPDKDAARMHGVDAKAEAWYVLESLPGSKLYAGFNARTDAQQFANAVAGHHVDTLLASLPAKHGSAVYIPAGTVHAIGEGCLLLEVQQNSDTTYRIYDWNRLDNKGQPRATHLEKALGVIDWSADAPHAIEPHLKEQVGRNRHWTLVKSPFFTIDKIDLMDEEMVSNDGRSFHALFASEGGIRVEGNGMVEEIRAGSSCLLPAALKSYSMKPLEIGTSLIRTSIV